MKPNLKDPGFLGALVYFNAAARSQSFQIAAAELGVTPSAVSHRIAALEEALGQKLFRREIRKVLLTQEGTEFANVVRDALGRIRDAAAGLTKKHVLRVSVGPYLSSTWLMARLKSFEMSQLETRVDLIHAIGATPPRDADVSIIWEEAAERGKEHHILFDTGTIPVAAPGHASDPQFWNDDIVPVHYRDRQAWRHWLRGVGAPADFAEFGEVFDDPNLVFEAAIHGRGVAIGFLPFIAELLASRKLVTVNETVVPAKRAYTVVINDPAHELATRFAEWLFEQAAETRDMGIRR